MAAIGKITAASAISRRLVEAGFHANWQLLQAECGLGHLVDVQAAISTGDGEATVVNSTSLSAASII
jgi:hypothetical protein